MTYDIQVQFSAVVRLTNGVTVNAPIAIRLGFRMDDPLAVHLAAIEDGAEVDWVFSRELMMRGVTSPEIYGDADVRFQMDRLDPSGVMMCLRSPEGHADVWMPKIFVIDFLNRTADAVAVGHEQVDGDLDAELTKILEGSA